MEVKRLNDDYIEVDGEIYERQYSDVVSVDLELEEELLTEIDEYAKGKFVSRSECIRHVLREAAKRTIAEFDNTEALDE
jgi:metal-responsive CopG/Arc/MetJ family transcriptional regulator